MLSVSQDGSQAFPQQGCLEQMGRDSLTSHKGGCWQWCCTSAPQLCAPAPLLLGWDLKFQFIPQWMHSQDWAVLLCSPSVLLGINIYHDR